ncbi:RagB/SusD family nutrient uptake outer membrane protein [Pedobacter nyackensis]|uniref:RagB/SusD family nutrient uptake outer membrane protein n=1 Tax=Pedobacter nyackensis TaxID=475255 RepID=UPI00292CCB07|nr:RagB/SusD family nutrient uptake outer membrane protein [Pedobacter nyackensis]
MKKYILILLGFIGIGTFTACNKWLDVKPEDKFIERDLLSSPQGFADVMNGFYINMAGNNMYGARLTSTTLDAMAQLYRVGDGNASFMMSNYTYNENSAKLMIDAIWSDFYSAITNANKFLENLDSYGSVLPSNTKALYQGETYGLRAMYYFDLLRLFTPTYSTADSVARILPYYDKTGFGISEFQPSNFIMGKILEDLNKAEALLVNADPAVTAARISKESLDRDGRTSRNYRLNYYAIKALKARVYLWRGDKESALKEAKFIIENQSKYPWVVNSDFTAANAANRIFATEMLFGVENLKLETIFINNFSPAIEDATLLAPESTGAFVKNTVFEGKEADWRYTQWFKIEGKPYPTFFKYKAVSSEGFIPSSGLTLPMIKASEMYLIAAECEPNEVTALDYLNSLRTNRNILPVSVLNATEIMKEYRKEFYGEGQLFYYYKRTSAGSVISANNNASRSISKANYTLPIPLSETTPR